MATGWGNLTGGGSNGSFQSTDYGTESNGAAELSNVQQRPSSEALPYYKGNRSRQAALFGNFQNPVEGQGTFAPSGDLPEQVTPEPIRANNFTGAM
jgi:hypothetical protein